MSFGRWLLVHSFTIFLLTLFVFAYIFSGELQLETAFQQLLNRDTEAETVKTTADSTRQATDSAPPTANIPAIKSDPDKNIAEKENQNSIPSIQILPTVSTIPAELSVQIESTESAVPDDRLFIARQAYWDKNYADAIYFYRQLIQQNSNNPDYLGELGNIYYSLNDNHNASRLYYQAALLFINQNQPDRARLLLPAIIAMNRELGGKLKIKLQ